MRIRIPVPLPYLISALLLVTGPLGCASGAGGTSTFMKKVNSIKPGTSQQAVRDQMGAPDQKRVGIVTSPPPPGPTENLPAVAQVGTAYQQWVYKRERSYFHVFFARDASDPAKRWKVIQVRSMPTGVVSD